MTNFDVIPAVRLFDKLPILQHYSKRFKCELFLVMSDDNPWGNQELKSVSGNRQSYVEPSFDLSSPPRRTVALEEEDAPWSLPQTSTYPPPSANPFNAPRTSALRTVETPKKKSTVRLEAPAKDTAVNTPLSSPGLDGPLKYSWQPKSDLVLGLAVVDFNHLVSSQL
jgi:hypothetical protein